MKFKFLCMGWIPLSLIAIPFTISCGSIPKSSDEEILADNPKLAYSKTSSFGKNVVLERDEYNKLYDEMVKKGKDYVAIAIIANHKQYEQVVPFSRGDKVWDILQKSDYDFNSYNSVGLGRFINSFKPKGTNEWLHGTREDKVYGDYYPLYYINHKFADLGVSNWVSSAHEVYEITYDDK